MQAGRSYSLATVARGALEDSGVPGGAALVAFADAVVLGADGHDTRAARAAVLDAFGPTALVDAAGVVASFNAVVRIADASGIPIEPFKVEEAARIATELGWEHRGDG